MDINSRRLELLGSVVEVKGRAPANVLDKCFEEIKRIEKEYSRFMDSSILSKANLKLFTWQEASPEFIYILLRAKAFNELTGGMFDITVKSVLDTLGYDKQYTFTRKPERKARLIERLANNLLQPVLINEQQNRILLRREIDFGGIAKGYAVDRVAQILEEAGVSHYYINAGGDIYAKAGAAEGKWKIVLEHPDDASLAIGTLDLNSQAIACSSPNRRKWNGYHHLINPKTKKPACGMKCVFALAKTAMEADVYAKAIFVAGFKNGIALSKKLGIGAIIVSENNEIYQSFSMNAELFLK
jgi:FAD:protein FMN transferase